MSSSSVARRYARALLSLGVEAGAFEAWGDELARVEAAFDESAALRDLWLNPAHGRDERLSAAEKLKEPLGLSDVTANLLCLLVERQRVGELPDVTRAYRAMVDEKLGRVRATVTSAHPLEPAHLSRIEAALVGMTGKEVSLTARLDPALIGGVVAQVGSTVLDGSVKTQLGRLRQALSG